MEVTVSIKTSPEGAGPLLQDTERKTVTVTNTPGNPQKVNLVLGGEVYTFMTAELGQAIMKASLIHG